MLDSFEQLARVKAHYHSVLALTLSDDETLLFSSGVDSVVNVWTTNSLQRLYSVYSPFEVGDIFSVAYSPTTHTIYCGAQNSSISWHQLLPDTIIPSSKYDEEPASRRHRFFDSLGPGGVPNEGTDDSHDACNCGGQMLTMSSKCYYGYAHKSYIYSLVLAPPFGTEYGISEVLISSDGKGSIKVWSLASIPSGGTLQLLYKLKNKGSSIFNIVYRAPFLYAGASHGFANVFNLSSQQLVQRLDVNSKNRGSDVLQVSSSEGEIFCGTSDGLLKVFDTKFANKRAWRAHDGKILATLVIKRKQQRLLVTGSNDNTIAFWHVEDLSLEKAQSNSNDELLSNLRQFVSYKTIPKNPACVGDCHEAASFLRKLFSMAGASTSLVSPQEGVNPLLIAKFQATPSGQTVRKPKTVLFYGHYDVVEARQETQQGVKKWHTDPFQVYPLDGFLYGRGVTDNKGPILAALHAASELVHIDALATNVVFLIEGDEEAGSRGFRKAVQEHKDDIGEVDYVLLSNSYWLDDHVPCLTFGMRGVVHATIQVSSGQADLHSGMDGKSLQHEPLKDLIVLMSSLTGRSGTEVCIPHFYDTVDPLQQSELRAYKSIATQLVQGHPEIADEAAFTQSLMQRWRDPNLTIHSVTVPESKTAVTISHRAKATLSIRIVPSQTADEVASNLASFLYSTFGQLSSNNTLKVDITAKADPWLGQVHNELYTELRSAIIEAWTNDEASQRQFAVSEQSLDTTLNNLPRMPVRGRRTSALASTGTFTPASTPHEPLFIREGGSIPAISFLEKEFGAPAAMFPMGQASDNAHLDNERMRVENLYKGRDVLKTLFSRLGTREASARTLRNKASTVTI